jgi:hypothetical protein
MEYMKLSADEREALIAKLAEMPAFLERELLRLTPQETLMAGPDEIFSPVEQAWHLADLEREGFGLRIRRLLSETDPRLPDFDGTAVAAQRNYRQRSIAEGLSIFKAARRDNLALLRSVPSDAWTRAGEQEGVGPVALCDMPSFMAQHDAAHRAEIEEWKRVMAPSS